MRELTANAAEDRCYRWSLRQIEDVTKVDSPRILGRYGGCSSLASTGWDLIRLGPTGFDVHVRIAFVGAAGADRHRASTRGRNAPGDAWEYSPVDPLNA